MRFLATYDIILHPSFQQEQMAKKRSKGPQSYIKAAFARVAHANYLKMRTNLLETQGRRVIIVSKAVFDTSLLQLRYLAARWQEKDLAFVRVFAWLLSLTEAVGDQGEDPAQPINQGDEELPEQGRNAMDLS
ncbi:hypothetical protein HDU90_008494 [Geranomyces variabilis]|nr:hypothetical protein HDU90_008494 [Geranomyces variabilis]